MQQSAVNIAIVIAKHFQIIPVTTQNLEYIPEKVCEHCKLKTIYDCSKERREGKRKKSKRKGITKINSILLLL